MVLPARFRRLRLLIVGCGDVGLRVARRLADRVTVLALTSDPARVDSLRAAGVRPLLGDLDDAASLARLAALGHAVLHLAPPPSHGDTDPRTARLLQALARKPATTRALVYGSTTGVYGDCAGARIDETRALRPATPRALRRADAEARVRWFGRRGGARVSVLRIPGIYAPDREGGDPRRRARDATPALRAEDDVYTNHVHADDLARACIAALFRGAPQRAYHASDDSELKMADWFDLAADLAGVARPPRVSRDEARALLSPQRLSFMGESRRLDNRRLKRELRVRLRYPTVRDGLAATG